MKKICPKCGSKALKLLYTNEHLTGTAYWTCLSCSWEKPIRWWSKSGIGNMNKIFPIEIVKCNGRVCDLCGKPLPGEGHVKWKTMRINDKDCSFADIICEECFEAD